MVVAIYSDGGLVGRNPSPLGATWAYAAVGQSGDLLHYESGSVRPQDVGLEVISSNVAELIALLNGLESLPPRWSGMVYCDSGVTLARFRRPGTANFRGVPPDLAERVRQAVANLGEVTWILLEGHPSRVELERGIGKSGRPVSRFNVFCDELCTEQAKQLKVQLTLDVAAVDSPDKLEPH